MATEITTTWPEAVDSPPLRDAVVIVDSHDDAELQADGNMALCTLKRPETGDSLPCELVLRFEGPSRTRLVSAVSSARRFELHGVYAEGREAYLGTSGKGAPLGPSGFMTRLETEERGVFIGVRVRFVSLVGDKGTLLLRQLHVAASPPRAAADPPTTAVAGRSGPSPTPPFFPLHSASESPQASVGLLLGLEARIAASEKRAHAAVEVVEKRMHEAVAAMERRMEERLDRLERRVEDIGREVAEERRGREAAEGRRGRGLSEGSD